MSLISKEEFANAARLNGFAGNLVARFLMQILGLSKINNTYQRFKDKKGIEFVDAIIDTLELKFEVSEEDLKKIPKEGSFVTVSNHPYGGIDGILLIKLLSEIRPDYKVMANYMLSKIEPMADHFFSVNPFENKSASSRNSFSGIKQSLTYLESGKALGIFPAGEVSTYYSENSQIADKQWSDSILKLIKKAGVPVVPIYFVGSNSWLFHILGRIHPILRTAKLPSELLNKKGKNIVIRIGNPISVKEQSNFPDISRYGRYLRARTYALGSPMEVKKFFIPSIKPKSKAETIIDPIPTASLVKEIEAIKDQYLLFENKNYLVLCTPSRNIPQLMLEIGRLREITFRAVGEGTNHSYDLDEYDLYYHQLVIWDTEQQKLVGAYRIGKGKEIYEQYGINGFYLHSLFKMKKPFHSVLKESLELGRSFIVEEYQRKPMSLFLLWKGILYFQIRNPEYRYMIGPVSISNEFSKFSKNLIVEYLKHYYYNPELAQHIYPRKEYIVEGDYKVDKAIFLENAEKDVSRIDIIIKDVEQKYSMPVLLKKYLSLGAQMIGFNIDPKFNDALDGLILVDIYNIPVNVIESLSKELNDVNLMSRFTNGKEK